MTDNEKKLLVELICNEQTHMIIKDHTRYNTDKYKELEALKIKIKDMWEEWLLWMQLLSELELLSLRVYL